MEISFSEHQQLFGCKFCIPGFVSSITVSYGYGMRWLIDSYIPFPLSTLSDLRLFKSRDIISQEARTKNPLSYLTLTEAKYDLENIEDYITFKLMNQYAATNTVDGIIEIIEKLDLYPYEHPLVKESFIKGFGVRRCYYKNYNIFYQIEENTVYILRVLSNRRDWDHLV